MIPDNIKKYIFGEPYDTGAVVIGIAENSGVPDRFSYDKESDTFYYKLKDRDMVFGLGETVRGINKRGWIYISNNSDDPVHDENKTSLYASQNFLLIDDGKDCFGIFIDNPGSVTFDIGYTDADVLSIHPEYNDTSFYVIEGLDPAMIVRSFRELIGK